MARRAARRPSRKLGATLLVLSLLGCGTPAPAVAPPPPRSTSSVPKEAPPTTTLPPSEVPVAPRLQVASIVRWSADPGLAKAAALATDKPAEAAELLLDSARAPGAAPNSSSRNAFVAGRLLERAGRTKAARSAFELAESLGGDFTPLARLHRARLLAAGGDHRDALQLVQQLDDKALPPRLLDDWFCESQARTLDGAPDCARRLYLTGPRALGWQSGALTLARALAIKARGTPAALLGIELVDAIEFEAPRGAGAEAAASLREALIAKLPAEEQRKQRAPDADTRVKRLLGLAKSSQGKRGLAAAKELRRRHPALDPNLACQVSLAEARLLLQEKRRSESADAYAAAVASCADRDSLANALLGGAQTDLKTGRRDRGLRGLDRIEKEFADHRLADDGRWLRAELALSDALPERFETLASSIARDFPTADLAGDASFKAALSALERGNSERSLALLSAAGSLPREFGYERAGRFRYFEGQALLQRGEKQRATAAFQRTLEDAPLSYYAALAFASLERLQTGLGASTEQAVAAKHEAAPLALGLAQSDAAQGVERTLVLLAQADDALALEEMLHLMGGWNRSLPADLLISGAELLAQAGAARAAHRLLRGAGEVEPQTGRDEAFALRERWPSSHNRNIWLIAYPQPFPQAFSEAKRESGVPSSLLYAVAREESAFDPTAKSRAGALGLMQIMPPTGKRMARGLGLTYKDKILYDPASSTRLGARFLRNLRERFSGAPVLAIPSYNAGPGAPERWLKETPGLSFDLFVERIPYSETRAYTKRVIATLYAYEVLYEQQRSEVGKLMNVLPSGD